MESLSYAYYRVQHIFSVHQLNAVVGHAPRTLSGRFVNQWTIVCPIAKQTKRKGQRLEERKREGVQNERTITDCIFERALRPVSSLWLRLHK